MSVSVSTPITIQQIASEASCAAESRVRSGIPGGASGRIGGTPRIGSWCGDGGEESVIVADRGGGGSGGLGGRGRLRRTPRG